jgi:hypothetical protein
MRLWRKKKLTTSVRTSDFLHPPKKNDIVEPADVTFVQKFFRSRISGKVTMDFIMNGPMDYV